mmetsp:Transcript_7405/g.16742  ORF Transcript_7405/g.16742 Transcript_7405/m.16742 type:complete len:86 (+) Transcript_7405:2441-2698(+)
MIVVFPLFYIVFVMIVVIVTIGTANARCPSSGFTFLAHPTLKKDTKTVASMTNVLFHSFANRRGFESRHPSDPYLRKRLFRLGRL